jgi:hypothetical protein
VTLQEPLSQGEFRFSDREDFEFRGGDVIAELASKDVCIVPANGGSSDLDCER